MTEFGALEDELGEPTFHLYDDAHWGHALRWNHNCIDKDGKPVRSNGAIPVDVEHPKHWNLVSHDPITITPSILCIKCNCHGFITNGKWVPA